MRAPTTLALGLTLLALPLAGCFNGADDAPSLSVRPNPRDSVAAFTVDAVDGDLAYEDLLILVDDRAFRFGPRADLVEGWFDVEDKEQASEPVELGDDIFFPAAGPVSVEFRHARNGQSLARLALNVPDHMAPAAPTAGAPQDGAASVQRQTHFQWSSVSDPAGVSYQLEYWLASGPANAPPEVVTGLEGTSHTATASNQLLPAQTYRWHVRAIDGMGNVGPWSGEAEFTTGL